MVAPPTATAPRSPPVAVPAPPTATPTVAPAATLAAAPTPTPGAAVTPLPTPTLPRGLVLISLHMFDQQRGLAIDSTHRLLTTADGGATWWATGVVGSSTVAPLATFAGDPSDAIVPEAAALVASTDAGRSFRRLPLPAAIKEVDGLSFADPRHGWIMANVHGFAGSETLDLFATADGGRTWARVATANVPTGTPGPLPFAGDKFGIAFRDDRTGWGLHLRPVAYRRRRPYLAKAAAGPAAASG